VSQIWCERCLRQPAISDRLRACSGCVLETLQERVRNADGKTAVASLPYRIGDLLKVLSKTPGKPELLGQRGVRESTDGIIVIDDVIDPRVDFYAREYMGVRKRGDE